MADFFLSDLFPSGLTDGAASDSPLPVVGVPDFGVMAESDSTGSASLSPLLVPIPVRFDLPWPVPDGFREALDSAAVQYREGRAAVAVELLKRLADCRAADADLISAGGCELRAGLSLLHVGRIAESLAAMRRAIRLLTSDAAMSSREPSITAGDWLMMAMISAAGSDVAAGRRWLNQAAQTLIRQLALSTSSSVQQASDRRLIGDVFAVQAFIRRQVGRLDGARRAFSDAFRLHRIAGDHQTAARDLLGMADAEDGIGWHQEAHESRSLARQVLELSCRNKDMGPETADLLRRCSAAAPRASNVAD